MKIIKLLPKHYLQAEVTVEIDYWNPFIQKEIKIEAKGIFCHHVEDKSLNIFFN